MIFTSDNGPHAEGGNNPAFQNSSGPLRGIKRSLTEGGIRVPMIAHWSGHIEAGSTSDFAGAFWDILPTFADLAGASKQVPAGLDGISFVPTLLGKPSQEEHKYLYWAFYEQGGAQAIRQGDWKMVQQPIHTEPRLYNLAKDLNESINVAEANAAKVAELKQLMDEAYVPNENWKFPKPKGKKQ